MNRKSNIVLIGMPGSGKSTLGRRLAALRGYKFVDTDTLIERYENKPIQDIVNFRGLRYLRSVEERVLLDLKLEQHVIATGGSAVYSWPAMTHLAKTGLRVYLEISLPTLLRRVHNTSTRGLVKMPQHPLARLYFERLNLYRQAADLVADNNWPMTALRFDALNTRLDSRLSIVVT